MNVILKHSLPGYLTTAGRKTDGFMPFQRFGFFVQKHSNVHGLSNVKAIFVEEQ